MSETSRPISAEHIRYLAERTTPEDDFLRGLREEAKAAGLPTIAIRPEQGSLMQILLRLIRAREVVIRGLNVICIGNVCRTCYESEALSKERPSHALRDP